MKYAVIKVKGTQYKVSEGDEILVGLTDTNPEINVLLLSDNGKVTVGQPFVKSAKVAAKIVTDVEKGEKVRVVKFKSKSRYRRTTGFRPKYTRLLIEKIS